MEKKKIDIKSSFATKSTKIGSYNAAVIAIVLAIAVVINLLAAQLPSSLTGIDMSPEKIYTIGTQTEKVLKQLDQDITINVLCAKQDSDDQLNKMLDKYKEGSKHIKIEYIDPLINIAAANQYSDLNTNSLVVTCGDREKKIDIGLIYVTNYDQFYYSGQTSTTFDGEGQLTSAIVNLTADNLPTVYTIGGHGETAISSNVSQMIDKQNINIIELNLLSIKSIPDDCDALFINAPTLDFSTAETNMVLDYLHKGGKALILATYTDSPMKNFKSIIADYGITLQDGVAMETEDHFYQYPMYVIPIIDESSITTDLVAERANIMIPSALSLVSNDNPAVTLTPLLSSTSNAYLKQVSNNQIATYKKEDGDISGPFEYAYLATKSVAVSNDSSTSTENETTSEQAIDTGISVDENNSSKTTETAVDTTDKGSETAEPVESSIIVIAAESLIDDTVTESFSLGNLDFFSGCLVNLCNNGDEENNILAIDSKSMSPEYIAVPAGQSTIWKLVSMILIPLLILIAGFVVWIIRRRK